MKTHGRQLHLVLDDFLPGNGASCPQPRTLETVRLPDEVSYLHPDAAPTALVTDTSSTGDLVIEPLTDGPQPRLLLLTPDGTAAPTVNGRRAPRVALLRVGDQLLLSAQRIAHVTAYITPIIGPATKEQAKKRCPVCRTPVKENARAFTCPCGTVYHHDDPARAAAKDCLECATLPTKCTVCRLPVCLRGGFQYVPDFS